MYLRKQNVQMAYMLQNKTGTWELKDLADNDFCLGGCYKHYMETGSFSQGA